MNDQAPMGVSNSITNLYEQFQLIAKCKPRAVSIDRDALDVFHNQIGSAIPGMPGVNHMNNRRMVKRCQDLPFPQKTVVPYCTELVSAQELDCYSLLNLAVSAFGQKNGTHSAAAKQPY